MIDCDAIVNAILDEDHPEIDEEPEGLHEYYLSGHSKDLAIIEGFDFSDEWLETQPALNEFLKEQLSDWWEDLPHDDPDIFRNWLDGNDIRISVGDAYLDTLIKDLLDTYRKRITETWTCEECGKTISEKYPRGHLQSISRIGIPDTPDGKVPKDMLHSEIKYINHIYCYPCWKKLFIDK